MKEGCASLRYPGGSLRLTFPIFASCLAEQTVANVGRDTLAGRSS